MNTAPSDLIHRRDIANVLASAEAWPSNAPIADNDTARAWLSGYYAALDAVAVALGIEMPGRATVVVNGKGEG